MQDDHQAAAAAASSALAVPAAPAASTRPQQLVNSPGASLPIETLQDILAYTLEGMTHWEAQTMRLTFGRVAVLWWEAAEVNKWAVVRTAEQAAGLFGAIENGRDSPWWLKIEAPGAVHDDFDDAVVNLLGVCPQLEALLLTGRERHPRQKVGDSAHRVLRGLSELRCLTLDNVSVSSKVLLDLLSSWPLLRNFRLLGFNYWQQPRVDLRGPLILHTLEIGVLCTTGYASPVFDTIVHGAASTLDTLRVYVLPGIDQAALSPFLLVAPRLRVVHIIEQDFPHLDSTSLEPFLDRLEAIEYLDIGPTGHNLSELFARLGRFAHLRTFKLRYWRKSKQRCGNEREIWRSFNAMDAVDYLRQATHLRSLTLPSVLKKRVYWTAEQVQSVEEAARVAGVVFKLE